MSWQVSIGGFSRSDLLERMRSSGIALNAIALHIFEDDGFRPQEHASTIEVVQTSAAALGLPDGAVLSQIIDAAEAHGLVLCPLETGPHLRLAFLDQAEGSAGTVDVRHKAPPGSVTVVDHRPTEHEDEYRGFYLRRIDGTLWLRGYTSWPGHVWQPQDLLVFKSAQDSA